MNWKAHLVVAGVIGFFAVWGKVIGIEAIPLVLLGALFPDLDAAQSKATNWSFHLICLIIVSYALLTFGLNFLYLLASLGVCVLLWAGYLVLKPRHRGWVHSFSALAIFSVLVFLLSWSVQYTAGFSIGYFSHLACDAEFKLF